MRGAIIAGFVVAIATPSAAQQKPLERRLALQNAIDEYVLCSSFYVISAQCVRNNPSHQPSLAARLAAAGDKAYAAAIQIAKGIGMKPEAFAAKTRMINRDHLSTVSSDCANISILVERHLETCKALLDDPETALRPRLP